MKLFVLCICLLSAMNVFAEEHHHHESEGEHEHEVSPQVGAEKGVIAADEHDGGAGRWRGWCDALPHQRSGRCRRPSCTHGQRW